MTVEHPKKLGFGLMRLPKRGVGIDIAAQALRRHAGDVVVGALRHVFARSTAGR